MSLRICLLCFWLLVVGSESFGQDQLHVKRIRVSLDAGFPNLIGLNGEYVLPYMDDRFSVSADLSYLPAFIPNSKITISYLSLGPNVYLNKKRNLYFGINIGYLNFNSSEIDGRPAEFDVSFTPVNSKFGLQLGNDVFFKMELGYSMIFYNLDKVNAFLTQAYNVSIAPDITFLQLANGKIGVGFRF